jgi:predicted RNA-binding protein YlqC (UPF0109 family)
MPKTEGGHDIMPSIDQQFVEYIVKSLVNNPDDVIVDRTIDEKGVLLSLTVNPDDLGRVIGKRGITAQSLRTLLRALGTKNDARYNLKIVNNDNDREGYNSASDYQTSETVNNSSDEVVENDESDYAKKSRKELAELDDLDI